MRVMKHIPHKVIYLTLFVLSLSLTPLPLSVIAQNIVNTNSGKVYAAGSAVEIYKDSVSSSWNPGPWSSDLNPSNPSPTFEGNKSIYFKPKLWGGVNFKKSEGAISINESSTFDFALNARESNGKIKVMFYDGNGKEVTNNFQLEKINGGIQKGKWVEYSLPLKEVAKKTSSIRSFAFQNTGSPVGAAFFFDEIKFSNVEGGSESMENDANEYNQDNQANPSPTPSPTPEYTKPEEPSDGYQDFKPTPSPEYENKSGGRYTTGSGKIYKDGKQIQLKGVSWFGFEGGTKVVHGLWQRNWKDMISQIKSTGFNAVRVPFCPSVVDNVGVTSIDYGKNPDLQGLKSLEILDKVVNELNNQQMYILLDHHTPDCAAISDLWYTGSYSEQSWIDDLKFLAARYKNLSYFMGMDIKNEPKGSATWGTGNSKTDWNLAVEKASKQILQANNNILIFVQGVQSNPTCSSTAGHWWGGNMEPMNCTAINSSSLPKDKMVYSPHVYGPDVYMQPEFTSSEFPNNLRNVWERDFGFLINKGYTVVPGEWGGRYGNGGTAKDVTWHNALVSYFKEKGICSSFYWDWNPNSGDTGGVLKDDWSTVWKNKADMLNSYFNSCK